jgi:hypothetical protein
MVALHSEVIRVADIANDQFIKAFDIGPANHGINLVANNSLAQSLADEYGPHERGPLSARKEDVLPENRIYRHLKLRFRIEVDKFEVDLIPIGVRQII